MKKKYIAPLVKIHDIKIETVLAAFSEPEVTPIGEGDYVVNPEQLQGSDDQSLPGSDTGEGLI